jgi:hypothetical protein
MNSWRLGPVLIEALRGLRAAGTRSVLVAASAFLLVGLLSWSEFTTAQDLVRFEEEFTRAGGWVAVATNEGVLPSGLCESLVQRPEVVVSGASATGSLTQVMTSPGTFFQSEVATVGAIRLWTDSALPAATLADGLVVGQAAASELGLRAGMFTEPQGGSPMLVAAVIDTAERNPQAQRRLISVAAPAGLMDKCWVEFSPGTLDAGMALLRSVFDDPESEPIVRSWIESDEFTRNTVEEFTHRPQAQAWAPAGALIAILLWVGAWSRRSELGLYRTVGTSRSTLWVLGQAEALVVVLPAATAGILWACVAYGLRWGSPPPWDQAAIALRGAASVALMAILIGPLAWIVTGRDAIAHQLKDR